MSRLLIHLKEKLCWRAAFIGMIDSEFSGRRSVYRSGGHRHGNFAMTADGALVACNLIAAEQRLNELRTRRDISGPSKSPSRPKSPSRAFTAAEAMAFLGSHHRPGAPPGTHRGRLMAKTVLG